MVGDRLHGCPLSLLPSKISNFGFVFVWEYKFKVIEAQVHERHIDDELPKQGIRVERM